MPEVASGPYAQASIMRMQLANCARWQTLTGAADADEASNAIFVGGFNEDGEETPPPRPRAMVRVNPEECSFGDLNGVMSGIVRITVELEVPDEYKGLALFGEAEIWFMNHFGQLISELRALGRAIAGGYLPASGTIDTEYVARSDEDRWQSEGDFYAGELAYTFGV